MTMDLYRFYDRDATLLYVGISASAAQRASQHQATKSWWPDVARMEIEHLDTESRKEAESIERSAILAERPLYNIVHNTPERTSHSTRAGQAASPFVVQQITRPALPPAEAAEMLGVTRQTIYKLIERGQLRRFKVGRCTRIPVADVLALIGISEGGKWTSSTPNHPRPAPRTHPT